MKEITPVADIYTQFPTKFGIPRQSGLADTKARIVLRKEFRSPDAVRGMEDYSHLWLIWEFTEAKGDGRQLTVRPPRLGGNTRVGVFATRSPFRPNSLGLSCVKIEKIDFDCPDAPVIYVSGADILDGTPVYDIKPYLPFTDARPDARGGFAEKVAEDRLGVVFAPGADVLPEGEERDSLVSILKQDPRPHYQHDPERVYSFEFSSYRIRFTCDEINITVRAVEKL